MQTGNAANKCCCRALYAALGVRFANGRTWSPSACSTCEFRIIERNFSAGIGTGVIRVCHPHCANECSSKLKIRRTFIYLSEFLKNMRVLYFIVYGG